MFTRPNSFSWGTRGRDKNYCLFLIREQLKEIHGSFEKLDYDEMLPCICEECGNTKDPYFHKYSTLERCRKKGRPVVMCDKSLMDVPVKELLKGIEVKGKPVLENSWEVFISYSSKDIDIIKEITRDFKKHSITFWLDRVQIKFGDNIVVKVQAGLKNSRYILPCFSHNQLESGWSKKEYESVLYDIFSDKESRKKVIPLIIDDLDPQRLPPLIRPIKHARYSDNLSYQELLEYFKGF